MKDFFVVHDVVPETQFEVTDQLADSATLISRNPIAMLPTEVSTESHAGSNGVAVKHTSGELVTWRPCVAIGVRPVLDCGGVFQEQMDKVRSENNVKMNCIYI